MRLFFDTVLGFLSYSPGVCAEEKSSVFTPGGPTLRNLEGEYEMKCMHVLGLVAFAFLATGCGGKPTAEECSTYVEKVQEVADGNQRSAEEQSRKVSELQTKIAALEAEQRQSAATATMTEDVIKSIVTESLQGKPRVDHVAYCYDSGSDATGGEPLVTKMIGENSSCSVGGPGVFFRVTYSASGAPVLFRE